MTDPIAPVEPVIPAQQDAPAPIATPELAAAVAAVEFTPPAAPAAEPHPADIPSLLDVKPEEKPVEKPAEAKPAEAKPAEGEAKPGEKPAEAKVAEEAPKPVEPEKIEWKIELPETLKADEPTLAKFTGALDGLFKTETRDTAVKDLLALHNDALQTYANETLKKQISTFNDTRREWAKQVAADPQIGGAGHQTAMGAIARVRDAALSDAKPGTKQYESDVKELNDFLRITGAGDHPVFLKMLHRMARYIDEPSIPPSAPKPTKTNGIKPSNSLYRQPAEPR